MSHFWLKIFVETRRSSASLELLIDLLAYLESELWLKNPIFHKNKKMQEKRESSSGNSPATYARELFKPSKD